MNIFIAVLDAEKFQGQLHVVGAFSDEKRARAACQDEADEENGGEPVPLAWAETAAIAPGGGSYDVILTDLDERIA